MKFEIIIRTNFKTMIDKIGLVLVRNGTVILSSVYNLLEYKYGYDLMYTYHKKINDTSLLSASYCGHKNVSYMAVC